MTMEASSLPESDAENAKYEAGIIADLEAMALDRAQGFWPVMLAFGTRRMLRERDALIAELAQALQGVIRVADRETVEFDAARAALAKVPKGICVDVRGN